MQLVIFNGLIGNCDAHAKNLSFIHGENGTTLAPFFDAIAASDDSAVEILDASFGT